MCSCDLVNPDVLRSTIRAGHSTVKAVLVPDNNASTCSLHDLESSSITVRASRTSHAKAFLVRKYGANESNDRPYTETEPSFTIRAFGRKSDNHWHQADTIVDQQVKAVTPRACLRLFGDKETADSIWLPERKSLAMEVVGNGASWEIMQVILRQISGGVA